MRIMNTTTSELTKVRPCDLLYCGSVNPDRGIFMPMDERTELRTPDEHLERMAIVQERLFKLARDGLHRHDATYLQAANNRPPPTSYAESSYVILQPSNPPTRTKTPMEGHLQVIKYLGNSHYLLKDLIFKKERKVHISRMKKYRFNSAFTSPQGVAARDRDEFLVEAILDHRGNFNRKSELEVLVKWVGYETEYNEWIPWSNLRRTDRLHTYLHDIGKDSVIPREFR